jgi:hypothetical protein
MLEKTAMFEKRYVASSPWLGMSVAYQVSLDAARVYESIRNGANYVEDITYDTNIPVAELSPFLQELITLGAVWEDDDDLPESLGIDSMPLTKEKGYNFSKTSFPDLFAVNKANLSRAREEIRRERGKPKTMPTNLMNIMKDDNLAAIISPNSLPSSAKTPSPEELAVLMQQMMMAQQVQQSQTQRTQAV